MRAQFAADGIAGGAVAFERAGDLRYAGQGYELRVRFPAGTLDDEALATAWEAFHRQHETEYGHRFPGSKIEIVNIRVTGIGPMPKIGKPVVKGGDAAPAPVKSGRGVFRVDGELKTVPTNFYRREALPIGTPVAGPAIILQMDTTTVVPPEWTITADEGGNLILRHGAEA